MAPLTGVAFIVLLILSFVIGGEPPDAKDSADEIAAHYTEDKDAVMFGAALGGIAVVFFVFFANILRDVVRRAEGPEGRLSPVILAGAAILATGAAFDGTLSFAMAEAADDIPAESLQSLQALWDNDFLPMAVGLATFLISSGLSILRTGVLPKWLGGIAVLLGVLAITPIGFAAFIGGAVFVLIVSVMLTMRERNAVGPTADSPPATATPAA